MNLVKLSPKKLYESVLEECSKHYPTRVIVSQFCEELNGSMEIGSFNILITSPLNKPYNEKSCLLIHEFGHILELQARIRNRNVSKLTYSTYGIEKRAWEYGIKYFAKLNLLPKNIEKFMESCLQSYSKKYGSQCYIRSLI